MKNFLFEVSYIIYIYEFKNEMHNYELLYANLAFIRKTLNDLYQSTHSRDDGLIYSIKKGDNDNNLYIVFSGTRTKTMEDYTHDISNDISLGLRGGMNYLYNMFKVINILSEVSSKKDNIITKVSSPGLENFFYYNSATLHFQEQMLINKMTESLKEGTLSNMDQYDNIIISGHSLGGNYSIITYFVIKEYYKAQGKAMPDNIQVMNLDGTSNKFIINSLDRFYSKDYNDSIYSKEDHDNIFNIAMSSNFVNSFSENLGHNFFIDDTQYSNVLDLISVKDFKYNHNYNTIINALYTIDTKLDNPSIETYDKQQEEL